VIYTALTVLFMLACVGIGALGRARAAQAWLAAGLAAVMVLAQLTVIAR